MMKSTTEEGGEGSSKNHAKAIEYYSKCSEFPNAQFNMGKLHCYSQEPGVNNLFKAVDCWRIASSAGHLKAIANMPQAIIPLTLANNFGLLYEAVHRTKVKKSS